MKNLNDLYQTIGKNLKNLRKNTLGLSQEEFAEEINMSRSFISHVESPNVHVGISLDTLFYISKKYNIDIKYFFENNI